MFIGRIKWFGGLNNQTQKINNYGFILPIEGKENEKIFVHRNDIPVHLQDSLEGKNGEGAYVQFEIDYDDSEYSPQRYRKILCTNSGMARPLKLYDPLNTIKDFCDTLQSLWENRQKANLTEFKIFKFNGRGLLQGKRSEAERSATTILAYCGGWIEKKGKCGFTPLVIGKHQTCPTCGRLICPKEDCRYCSDNCRSYFERKNNKDSWNNPFDELF